MSEEDREAFFLLVEQLRNDECEDFDNEEAHCNEEWPTEEEISDLADALKTATNCESFSLQGDEGSQLTDENAIEIAEALKENTSVLIFYLRGHEQLGPIGARALADMLEARNQSEPIIEFHIGGCSIEDEGLEALTKVLPMLSTLETFAVDNNGLTDAGAELLAAATIENEMNGGIIENLDFEDNPDIIAGGEGEMKLVRAMIDCGIEPNEYTSESAQDILNDLWAKDEEEREAQDSCVLESLENTEADEQLQSLEDEMMFVVFQLMEGEKDDNDDNREDEDGEQPSLESLRSDALQVVGEEVDRIAKVTEERREYYSLGCKRWEKLHHINFNNESTSPHVQPVVASDCDEVRKKLLGENEEVPHDYIDNEKWKGVVARIHARSLSLYFAAALEQICQRINTAKDISDLKLSRAKLAFNDKALVGRKRIEGSCGPLKKIERALVKAAEYQEEIGSGLKADEFPDGHRQAGKQITGMDYVLDWLRATVTAQDPYLLYVFFLMLQKKPGSDFFRLQRVKNKFFDETYPPNIRTNVLLNVFLLYPPDEATFDKFSYELPGEWNATRAGQPLTSVEIQLTLLDFVTIKHLMHKYYKVQRSPDPLFLLRNPISEAD